MLTKEGFDKAFNQLCGYCRVTYKEAKAWRDEFYDMFQYLTDYGFKELVHEWVRTHEEGRKFPNPWELKRFSEPQYVSSVDGCRFCENSPGMVDLEIYPGKWQVFRCSCSAGENLASSSKVWRKVKVAPDNLLTAQGGEEDEEPPF